MKHFFLPATKKNDIVRRCSLNGQNSPPKKKRFVNCTTTVSLFPDKVTEINDNIADTKITGDFFMQTFKTLSITLKRSNDPDTFFRLYFSKKTSFYTHEGCYIPFIKKRKSFYHQQITEPFYIFQKITSEDSHISPGSPFSDVQHTVSPGSASGQYHFLE